MPLVVSFVTNATMHELLNEIVTNGCKSRQHSFEYRQTLEHCNHCKQRLSTAASNPCLNVTKGRNNRYHAVLVKKTSEIDRISCETNLRPIFAKACFMSCLMADVSSICFFDAKCVE